MKDLEGKIILITGATDGIGKAATTEFAKRGASITLVGRSKEKTDKVIKELEASTGNKNLDYIICDLAKIKDVKRAAQAFKAKHDRLDVLVNNAGATFKKPTLGHDGYEITFTLNHLAYFQMTHELLDLIRETPNARVVSTSSSMQALGKIDLNKISTAIDVSGPKAYATSKLANILFTKELQKKLAGTTAVANCFEPGMVNTQFGGFGSDQGCLINLVYAIAKPFAISPEKGADSLIWLATSKEALALQGEYVSKRRPIKPSQQALDTKLASDLWVLSEKICLNENGLI
ncbi:SDR family NAD(P)-dependent oxidoreductase [Xylella taiwanensis]|uniref:SDR family NAD(P)-dependent oxidoreductase n=1 Tax=Xylella taiwanensis TaxID=1444770 RepID=Z9JJ36_9GAMM|nr:SDR family NAD(P)-dependent oxidoreductase [Xylella taiwanensis]AXI83773.1 short-chain dehydrogenase [Xylella taiwanensis]EWS78184.1 short-chain dehydrogenase [Xylella taiwanensis]MCD8456878.1 SDR family NAD(P)-dependent oxidoreductase [Xylella taiwanensis]MCD8459289.1 SDR family NAD(P)-dependent oxidoreductase [Xylella taiwanensis]MCD8461840.1 SDR family NAD(P)-dependent oxidoreductase [Xylella taiwanensis]